MKLVGILLYSSKDWYPFLQLDLPNLRVIDGELGSNTYLSAVVMHRKLHDHPNEAVKDDFSKMTSGK